MILDSIYKIKGVEGTVAFYYFRLRI